MIILMKIIKEMTQKIHIKNKNKLFKHQSNNFKTKKTKILIIINLIIKILIENSIQIKKSIWDLKRLIHNTSEIKNKQVLLKITSKMIISRNNMLFKIQRHLKLQIILLYKIQRVI
jgi:hypothetical protein